MYSPVDREIERMMMKDDIKTLKTERSKMRGQIKRLQALANYILAAMSEEDYDSDPAIDKAFNKCDRAGDLG